MQKELKEVVNLKLEELKYLIKEFKEVTKKYCGIDKLDNSEMNFMSKEFDMVEDCKWLDKTEKYFESMVKEKETQEELYSLLNQFEFKNSNIFTALKGLKGLLEIKEFVSNKKGFLDVEDIMLGQIGYLIKETIEQAPKLPFGNLCIEE